MSFQELMATGGADEKQQIQALQGELQSDDPINIQFTSVRENSRVAWSSSQLRGVCFGFCDWLTKIRPLCQPMRSQTDVNFDVLVVSCLRQL